MFVTQFAQFWLLEAVLLGCWLGLRISRTALKKSLGPLISSWTVTEGPWKRSWAELRPNTAMWMLFFFLVLDLFGPFGFYLCGESILFVRTYKLFKGLSRFVAWSYFSQVWHFSLNIYFFIKYCLHEDVLLLSSLRSREGCWCTFIRLYLQSCHDCLAKPSSVIYNHRSKWLRTTDNDT